jgi:hypothetical protein
MGYKEEWQMSGYGSMGEGRQGADRMQDEAREKTGEVVEQAKQKTGEVVDQTRARAFDMMDQQKTRAADGLGSVASALRQTGDSLSSGDQAQIGQFAHRAADAVERFSGDLRDKDINQLFYEAEDFARREPELFLGGAVLLGLVAARFFKASNRRSMRNSQDYGRNRYEYGDRFGRSYGTGQYGGEIDYRSTGTGGYRTGTTMGPGGYMGAGGTGMSGTERQTGAAWTAHDEPGTTRRDIESEWMGDEDDPARKSDSSQA